MRISTIPLRSAFRYVPVRKETTLQNPIPRRWRIPLLLVGISLVPFAATTNRLLWLSDPQAVPDPAMAHFSGEWTTLIVHITFGSLFLILAAFQFSPDLRLKNSQWHRILGRFCMVAGLIAGLSAIWLVLGYPPSHLATPLMETVRAFLGATMVFCIIRAFIAIRARNISRHRAWMIRTFSLAVAGTTQAFLIGLWIAFSSSLTPTSATALIILGFVINIIYAEWRIQRVPTPHSTWRSQ